MLSYVKEVITSLDAEPMVVSCPGAAQQILELGESDEE
jgi:hypothetical protein